MENASKALIMAGAVLITIAVISLGIVVFTKFQNVAQNNGNLTAQQIEQINSKISPYIGDNISGSEVNALIQLVYAMNNSEECTDIEIFFNSSPFLTGKNYVDKKKTKVKTGQIYSIHGDYGGSGYYKTIFIDG